MGKKEYLNEEQFKKTNKKVKTAGTIILLIGLVLICTGIFNFIIASGMEIPKKDSSNTYESIWETKTAKSDRESLGALMLIPGIFITFVGCVVRFIISNQREISAYHTQQGMPIAQEVIEKMSPSMGTAAKEITKGIKEGLSDNTTTYCKYCGTQIDADSNFCSKCGKQL